MSSIVELQFDPYIPRLGILIDGKQPSDFSRLIQYTNEDILNWQDEIFDLLYFEIKDQYSVIFTGTKLDSEILKLKAKNSQYCVKFNIKNFLIPDSFQSRMIKLNKLIKTSNITQFTKTEINSIFSLSKTVEKYSNDIMNIDINNSFCKVKVYSAQYIESLFNNKYLFFITSDFSEIENYIKKKSVNCLSFIIFINADNKLLNIIDNNFIFETTEENLFDIIFQCFLSFPLLIAFRNCITSLYSNPNLRKQLLDIIKIEPIICCDIDLPIEVGKSKKLNLYLDPKIGHVPKLEFRIKDSSIATCNGLCVFGKNQGTTQLELYKIGEKSPFLTKDINVIKRNRIKKLMLSDDELILGQGDTKILKTDYAPINADNVNTIQWKSSKPTIVSVVNGKLTANEVGTCKVFCTAENVSAQCICQVKPYLENFVIENINIDNEILLTSMQEVLLKVKCNPQNSIDGNLKIISSDLSIVNVVGNKLIAKNKGCATITIVNSSERVKKQFKVNVVREKNNLLKKLFGK